MSWAEGTFITLTLKGRYPLNGDFFSLVLNRNGRHYDLLKTHLKSVFEDTFYDGDAIQLECNSRDYHHRVKVVDKNTEAVCDFLHPLSLTGGASDAVIKQVFYPKYYARNNYERYRFSANGRFGGLFSLTFTSIEASRAFYDALSCWKGPSFGTNSTLACAYVILTHYPNEIEWATKHGLEASLVRIGPGLEDTETLLKMMAVALDAAKAAVL
jgi:cystathionine gamma-synthase